MSRCLTIQDWALCVGRNFIYWFGDIGVINYKNISNLEHASAKPILKTLDQMTQEDKEEFQKKFKHYQEIYFHKEGYSECKSGCHGWKDYTLEMYDFLTRKGYDVRGWIDQGLAIKYDEKLHGEFK